MVLGTLIALGIVIFGFYLALYLRNAPHTSTREHRRRDLTRELLEKDVEKQRRKSLPPTRQ